ncbi:MAG: hypothetical protein QMD88_08955 [Coprothermobacterota bacterium]|nr:hypothetical protein [Coprothermobacterota bacterium]
MEKGSQADLDQEKIMDFYESTLADLENRFQHKLSPSDLITVKLYPEFSGEVFHRPQFISETIGNRATIIDVYNRKDPLGAHELVHAYSRLAWGPPQLGITFMQFGEGPLNFLEEALATALDRYYSPSKGADLHAYASCFLRESTPYSLENLLAGTPPLG